MNKQLEKIFLSGWRPYFWIILSGALVYFKVLSFDFTYFDDNAFILDKHDYFKDPLSFIYAFGRPNILTNQFYRPVLEISFMVDAWIGGTMPLVYHFTSLVIHIINACLVYYLLQMLAYPSARSLFFSLLFCIHPIMTQAVAWVPGRTESLLAFFVLISFMMFVKWLRTDKKKYYFSHYLFWILGLFTKETAVILPVVCGLYAYLFHREKLASMKKNYLVAWLAMIGILLIIRKLVLGHMVNFSSILALESAYFNIPASVRYLGKIFLPLNLSVFPYAEDMTPVYGVSALILLLVAIIATRSRRHPHVLFGLAWFVLFLLPGFLIKYLEHEYRAYLAVLGIWIVLLETRFVQDLSKLKNLAVILAGFVLILFSAISFVYSDNFRNKYAFWHNAVKASQHFPGAFQSLGAIYYQDGMLKEAREAYERAIEINDFEPQAHAGLGVIYMDEKRFTEAETEFQKEILFNPTYDKAYYNYGVLKYQQGRWEDAEGLWLKAIDLNPDYLLAYRSLILFYHQQKNLDKIMYYVTLLKSKGVDVDQPPFKR